MSAGSTIRVLAVGFTTVCLALVTAPPLARAADYPAGLEHWTIDNLRDWVEAHRKTGGAFEPDLFPYPERGGFCPGWGDKLGSYYGAYSRECSEALVFSRLTEAQTAAAALWKCVGGSLGDPLSVLHAGDACKDSPVTPEDIALRTGESVEAARKKLEALRKQLRDEGVRQTLVGALDVASLWKDLVKCSLKAMATAGEMTQGERGEWRTLIDTIDAAGVDFEAFSDFAKSVARLGPMAMLKKKLPEKLEEIPDFVKETAGLGDAFAKAVEERASTLQEGLRTIPGVKEGELAGEVDAVLADIDACRLDKATDDAEVLANKIHARLIELRHRVVIAEKAVMCTANARRVFDSRVPAVSGLVDRQAFLDGRALVPNAPGGTVSIVDVPDWKTKTAVHNRLLDEYVKLRTRTSPEVMARRRADLEQLLRERAGRIAPLVQAAGRQIAACADRAKSGVTVPDDVLIAALRSEQSSIEASRCSEPLQASLGDELQRAIQTLDSVDMTRNRADAMLGEGRRHIDAALARCDLDPAWDQLVATARDLSLQASLASNEPDLCYRDGLGALKKSIEARSATLSTLAREADRAIADARVAHASCRPGDAGRPIAAARAAIGRTGCPGAIGAQRRLDHLAWLERQTNPECERTARLPDAVFVVVTVSGSGFVPHWSGGSWAVQGQDDRLLTLKRDESLTSRIEALKKELVGDPCRATSPSISGAHRPWFWSGKEPQVGIKHGPEPDRTKIAPSSFQDTWHIVHDKGPSLFDLKKSWGCGG